MGGYVGYGFGGLIRKTLLEPIQRRSINRVPKQLGRN